MRKIFTSKIQRKQAEAAIIRDMRQILSDLNNHKNKEKEKIDKEQILSILTKFVKLKSSSKIN